MTKTQAALKRLVVGRPMASGELEHTLLPKILALPVFSSDPLSSVAYATQEILVVLALVGATALHLVMPITLAVASLLTIVVISYRQTVRAYPNGGGAYIVSHENLGMWPGLLAAAALLVDYVLTVSVSIVAGVDALLSAQQGLIPFDVAICLGFVVLVTLANLRGAKESGAFFAIPTYAFVASIYILLIVGMIRCVGGCPQAESAQRHLEPETTLTFLLMLRAFAQGTTALTGVEAISNGVPAFRYPQSRNAATTLGIMGFFSISMFLGISWLADVTNVHYAEQFEDQRTVVAQIANTVFNGGFMFYVVQIATAAILILAANTAFQDFPRLSSILARDKFMPHQFLNRGDRLVFSNGIVILALLASLLVYVFDANINKLIHLYLVGVFVSFTLSQTGMVVHWRRYREQEPRWKSKSLINGFGAVVTGIVLVVVLRTKVPEGAWIVVIAIPVLMLMMRTVHRHYESVAAQLEHPERRPPGRRPGNQHMVILAHRVDAVTARAVGYVRSIRASHPSAVTFDSTVHGAWNRLAPEIPLETVPRRGSRSASLKAYLRERRADLDPHDFLTVVIPESLRYGSLVEIFRKPALHKLKADLLTEEGVQVLDVPLLNREIEPGVDQAHEPTRNFCIVLVSGVNNATLQAIEYAETLQPTDARAVTFALDPEETERIGIQWLEAGIPVPLEIEDSPFREIGTSIVQYVRQFKPDGVNRVVTVIIPEFVVGRTRHNILHGQTALLVKRRLLFERGVVAVSIPYHLER